MSYFENRVYLVSGGGRGIGRAVAEDLAHHGARVVVLEYNAALNDGFESNVTFVQGDVTRPDDCQRAVAACEAMGRLDGLCLIAGIEPEASRGPFWKVDPEVIRRTIDIDVLGHYYLAAACIPYMLQQIEAGEQEGGSIVCTSSVQAVAPAPQTLPHVIGKAAILGFARGATLELAPRGIKVNTVVPGTIMTEGVIESLEIQGGAEANAKAHPRQTQGSVEEVAAAFRWFLGPESSNCYGAELTVDGGASVPGPQAGVVNLRE